jgi:hypothetical protein
MIRQEFHEFSPLSGRPLPLTAAERARLMAIIERSDRILAKDPEALAEAERLARRAGREQREKRRAELLAHLEEIVAQVFERHGHWLCRDVGRVAGNIRAELESLAGPAERWTTHGIDRAIREAIK